MDDATRARTRRFLQDQLTRGEFRAQGYVFGPSGTRNPTRNAFLSLSKYIKDFSKGTPSTRWVAIPGLRGTGKTTLLAQLYCATKTPKPNKLFLSVDHISQHLGVGLKDVLDVYEEMVGGSFEELRQPVFIFLDEVQYDKRWAMTIKLIYDRSPKVFFVCTGSSALLLQVSPDAARRMLHEKLFPMSFTEYMKVKHQHFEQAGLAAELRSAIFDSRDAEEVYRRVKDCEDRARKYWSGVNFNEEVQSYLAYGTLPYIVAMGGNESLAYDQIKKTLDRVISVDIVQLDQFSSDIVGKIGAVLYMIAGSNMVSLTSMSNQLGISRPTVTNVFGALEKTETIIRILPYGSISKRVRKPSRYLFSTPAFRSMFFNLLGAPGSRSEQTGKLLEDAVALSFSRILYRKSSGHLSYDSAEGGADFIVHYGSEAIVAEVGWGKKSGRQVYTTLKKVASAKYGIIISSSPSSVDLEKRIVSIPISYFFLI